MKCEEQRDYYNLTPDNLYLKKKAMQQHYMIKNKQIQFYEFSKIRICIPLITVAFSIVVCPLSGLTHVWKGTA